MRYIVAEHIDTFQWSSVRAWSPSSYSLLYSGSCFFQVFVNFWVQHPPPGLLVDLRPSNVPYSHVEHIPRYYIELNLNMNSITNDNEVLTKHVRCVFSRGNTQIARAFQSHVVREQLHYARGYTFFQTQHVYGSPQSGVFRQSHLQGVYRQRYYPMATLIFPSVKAAQVAT